MGAKSFDPRCYELAAVFLAYEDGINTEAAKITLAAEIQKCIEDEIDFMRSMMEMAP